MLQFTPHIICFSFLYARHFYVWYLINFFITQCQLLFGRNIMSELMLLRIRHTLLEDLSLVCLLSRRRRVLRTSGLFIRRVYKDVRYMTICGYVFTHTHLFNAFKYIKTNAFYFLANHFFFIRWNFILHLSFRWLITHHSYLLYLTMCFTICP